MDTEVNNSIVEARKPLTLKSSDTCEDITDDSDLDTGVSWIVLCASFGTSFLLGSALYAVGIIHSALLEKYQQSVTLTSWAGALHTALPGLMGPLSSAVIDAYSCRTAIVTSGILYLIGYLCTAFAPNIHVVIFTCGIVAGTAGGLAYTAAMVVISFNFKGKLGLALGISSSGIGLGVFCLAPLMQVLRDYYGPTGFFIMLAAIYSHMIVFGILCFPSRLERTTHNKRKMASKTDMNNNCCRRVLSEIKRYWFISTNKAVLCYSFAMFNFCLGTYLIFLYLPDFIVHVGFSPSQAALLVSLSGFVGVFGRILMGFVVNSQRIHIVAIYSGSMGVIAVVSFIYPYVAHIYACQVMYIVVVGLVLGNCFLTTTGVNLLFVKLESISVALGIEFAIGGIGATLGPVFAGVLIDAYGSYELPLIIAAACTLMASVSGGVTYFFPKLSDSENKQVIVEVDIKM